MGQHLERGSLLASQQRFDLAERELRQALIEDPNSAHLNAKLALCLVAQFRLDEALQLANEAVALGPEDPDAHHVQATVLHARKEYLEAERAIQEAIRLAPSAVEHHRMLISALGGQERWGDALAAAEQGLKIDPSDVGCIFSRAMMLPHLDHPKEAMDEANKGLALSSNSATGHAVKGWVLIDLRQVDDALAHFRESLRIDPSSELARQGLVTALKHRFPVFALAHACNNRMTRMSADMLVALNLGILVFGRLLREAVYSFPQLRPASVAIGISYLLLAVIIWTLDALFSMLLSLSRFGRLALNARERRESAIMAAAMLATFAGLIAYPWAHGLSLGVTVAAAASAIPAIALGRIRERFMTQIPRAIGAVALVWISIGFTAAVFLVEGPVLAEKHRVVLDAHLILFVFLFLVNIWSNAKARVCAFWSNQCGLYDDILQYLKIRK